MNARSFSVVVNTYNRADSLRLTLLGLEQLDYPIFEVVVVNGPSDDDTEEVLAQYAGRLKVARCMHRNLSESRNIGVGVSAGEIVAFIDDDAYPDPAWLDSIALAYDDPEVAAAGGPVYNFTGVTIQAWSSYVDSLGNAWAEWNSAPGLTELLSAPASNVVPYTIGTNASFRRALLTAIGGFDEEFEYYLDESDVCRRLTDSGYVVKALDDGFVYHKFLPSSVRDRPDVVKDYYQVLKSKFYFALKHGTRYKSFFEVCEDLASFVQVAKRDVEHAVSTGALSVDDQRKFESDRHKASNAAFEAFLYAKPRTRRPEWFASKTEELLPFPTRRPRQEKLHVCYLTQEYPPKRVNGIGRVVHLLATGMAGTGHVIHVLTQGEGTPRVDLEEGVWVHRLAIAEHTAPTDPKVPARLWAYSATMCEELRRIHAHRPIDVVQAPNWDSEGIAAELDGRFRVVIGLYTPLKTLTRVDRLFAEALEGDDPTLRDMVDLERYVYEHAGGILACGPAVIDEVETEYEIVLDRRFVGLVPHGLPDPTLGVRPAERPGKVNVLFVGRLEARKGIDTLLECVCQLAQEFDDVVFTVVGDDSLPASGGTTFRRAFEASANYARGRVQFTGPVDDDLLRRFYAGCDILVVPSRFESFGLILLEAMMFSKPVVASAVGGIGEVVADGESGILVPPGDVAELSAALARLIRSPELRREMGSHGRRRFEECFRSSVMVQGAEAFYRQLIRSSRVAADSSCAPRSHTENTQNTAHRGGFVR
ncbi:MAG: glycosyltransferase [Acidimicrobiales bacterium]|jgi:glycosyltransferase involved in cell wall biosynthesis